MDGNGLTIQEEKLRQLKEILPEAFTEGKVDWEKLKATLGENINFSNERYVLNWAGKSDVFRALRQPPKKTLIPDEKQSIDFDRTDNIFIEGENLETLKVLQKSYRGKVKMIYIDPPYNTGSDSFVYPDKFAETKIDYAKRVGDIDEEGYLTKEWAFRKNSKENGQYHSNWLSMMYPRLSLAKDLLKEDGAIFISIDDNEVHNLRLIMNEIFGEDNFVAEFVWVKKQKASGVPPKNMVLPNKEYVLCYKKQEHICFMGQERSMKSYKKDKDGRWWRTMPIQATGKQDSYFDIVDRKTGNIYHNNWAFSKGTINRMIDEGRILFPKSGKGLPTQIVYADEMLNKTAPIFHYLGLYDSESSTKKLITLFKGKKLFDFPKPLNLLKFFIKQITSTDELILDFFAGSGTTAHAVMQLNAEDGNKRKCISVQLPEPTGEKMISHKEGYKTIAEVARKRISKAAEEIEGEIRSKIETKEKELKGLRSQLDIDGKQEKMHSLQLSIEHLCSQDLGFKVFKLADSNFKQWKPTKPEDAEAVTKQMLLFIDPVRENSTVENMVYELLLDNGKELNCKLEHKGNYYLVNDDELVFMLEQEALEMIEEIIRLKPQKVIALDRLFKGNDQLKTNTFLQMKDADVKFRTK